MKFYDVYLYPFAWIELIPFKCHADCEQDALEEAVQKAEMRWGACLLDVEDVEDENDDTVMYVDATMHWAKKPYYISTQFRIEEDTFTPKLIEDCKEFVKKTEALRWEYIRDESEEGMDYDDLSEYDCFNREEHDRFIEHFMDPFFKEHPEYNKDDDRVYEIVDEELREEMYNQDKYECFII